MTTTINGSSPSITFSDGSAQTSATRPFQNRLINGDMRIDQRNAGASVSTSSGSSVYTLDRFRVDYSQTSKMTVQQNAGSVTTPAGFKNYLGITSSSAYSVISSDYFVLQQAIEGFNTADLDFGTANAKTVTLSFWVRSSLTGTFGGNVRNSDNSRCYPFSYTISSANTWEQKSITIAGDTSGTWLTTNGVGMFVTWGLGVGSTLSGTAGSWGSTLYLSATGATSVVGTNGATFYITGVQLEAGSTATSFDYRPYGTELALCQRYYEKSYNIETAPLTSTAVGNIQFYGSTDSAQNIVTSRQFSVSKRTTPTMTYINQNGTSGTWTYVRSGATGNVTANDYQTGTSGFNVYVSTGAAYVVAYMYGHWVASAEL